MGSSGGFTGEVVITPDVSGVTLRYGDDLFRYCERGLFCLFGTHLHRLSFGDGGHAPNPPRSDLTAVVKVGFLIVRGCFGCSGLGRRATHV